MTGRTRFCRRLLGREAEPEGLAFWRDALDQGRMTRERVVLGFVQSDENFRNLIQAWHLQYLERQARADELAGYLAQMRAGASHRLIQIALIDTTEYRSQPALPPPGSVKRL